MPLFTWCVCVCVFFYPGARPFPTVIVDIFRLMPWGRVRDILMMRNVLRARLTIPKSLVKNGLADAKGRAGKQTGAFQFEQVCVCACVCSTPSLLMRFPGHSSLSSEPINRHFAWRTQHFTPFF